MGLGIPPIKLKILIESNPLKSRIVVRRLAVGLVPSARVPAARPEQLPSHWHRNFESI